MTAQEHVWQPGTIGPLPLPHRLVMGSMHMGLEGIDPSGEALAAFYAARVAGGAALIVTGGSAISRVAAAGRNYSFINEPSQWPALERVASAVHAAGGRILLQLFHAGRYGSARWFGLQPVAPSAIYSRFARCEPRELSANEIEATIADFAAGAAHARELGFDGVEIMGSEGYLLNQFMAPATNQRDDHWGGDSERRTRFPLAVARAIREAGGPGQAVVYRISGADLVDGGATDEEVRGLARLLASGPVDALNVGVGWHEARVPTVQAVVPHGAWTPWARMLREAVSVPVIASNRLNTVAMADAVLARGEADFVSMARPFLADPLLISKARSGGTQNICIACNQCIDSSIFDRRVSCVVNPRAGHEGEPMVSLGEARVAVVGGGPAGMEAARALAVAGARVALFEGDDELGGQFRMAREIPGKADFGRTIEFFSAELARLGVAVELGLRVIHPALLGEFAAVVVATGVSPRSLSLEGVGLEHVVPYNSLLLDAAVRAGVGQRVAIIGAGGIGVDVAHLLASPGTDSPESFYGRYGLRDGAGSPRVAAEAGRREVTLMRRSGRIGDGIGPSSRWAMVQELELAGVSLLTGVSYERITPEGVVVVDESGVRRVVEADTVVLAAGQVPSSGLAAALEAAEIPHIVIGGALDASGIDAGRAFRQGFESAGRVAELLSETAPTRVH
jgi:2,4-dienoyl-CoA reductase (NADPH2)